MPTIYVDILFVVNFVINLLLLFATAKIAGIKPRLYRLCLGALAGGIYGVIMFLPGLQMLYGVWTKIAFSLAIIAIAYNIPGIKEFVRVTGVFYMVCFVFGGVVAGVFYLTGLGAATGAIISSGAIYLSLPWQVLLIASVSAFIMLVIFVRALKKRVWREGIEARLTIICAGKSVGINALLDTGNRLCDPVTGTSVVVVDIEGIKELLPFGIMSALTQFNISGELTDTIEADWMSRIRLIPYKAIGTNNGVLPGFKPDYAVVEQRGGKKAICECIIGVYSGRLSENGSYSAIVNPELIV